MNAVIGNVAIDIVHLWKRELAQSYFARDFLRLLRFASVLESEDLNKKAIELLQDPNTPPKFKTLLAKQSKDVEVQDCLVNIFNTIANMLNEDAFAKGETNKQASLVDEVEEGAQKTKSEPEEGTGVKDEGEISENKPLHTKDAAPAPPSAPTSGVKLVPIVTKEQLNDEWTTEHQAFNMFIQNFYGFECRLIKLMKLCEQGIVLSFLGELGDLLLKDLAGYRTKDIRGTWELDVKKYADCYSFTHRRQEHCFVTTDNIMITNSFTFLWELEIVFDSFAFNHIDALFPRLLSVDINRADASLKADAEKLKKDEEAFRKIFSNSVLLKCNEHVIASGGKRKAKSLVLPQGLQQHLVEKKKNANCCILM